jgi:hypothetical protein
MSPVKVSKKDRVESISSGDEDGGCCGCWYDGSGDDDHKMAVNNPTIITRTGLFFAINCIINADAYD